MARDVSFRLQPTLLAPAPPFRHAFVPAPPWGWEVTDSHAVVVATARTRAGARAAVRALYTLAHQEPTPMRPRLDPPCDAALDLPAGAAAHTARMDALLRQAGRTLKAPRKQRRRAERRLMRQILDRLVHGAAIEAAGA